MKKYLRQIESFLPKAHGNEKQGKQILKEPNTYFIKKNLVAVF